MVATRREVRKYTDGAGRTLFYAVFLGTRRAGWRFFKPGEAPDFEGESAIFEVEVRKGGRWEFGRNLSRAEREGPGRGLDREDGPA